MAHLETQEIFVELQDSTIIKREVNYSTLWNEISWFSKKLKLKIR